MQYEFVEDNAKVSVLIEIRNDIDDEFWDAEENVIRCKFLSFDEDLYA